MSLKLCDKCKWNYPYEFLNQMYTGRGYTPLICGICALEISNQELGITEKNFHGEIAESMRLLALEWRREHSQNAPKNN